MPMKIIKCSTCGVKIKGTTFKVRMKKLRSHYKRKHPVKFARWHRR